MSLTEVAPYLIGSLPCADLTSSQIIGVACVYCAGREDLAHAGWLRYPLSPGRYTSNPVSVCVRCRVGRLAADEQGPA